MRGNQTGVGVFLAALVAAHAAYWFLGGEHLQHTEVRNRLVIVQLVIGVVAGIWLLLRARKQKA